MRIRTIKPEFWESENLGRASREARLLFIGLFSCCDDSGRTRASSRLLASRIFPYDTDAGALVEGWLVELEAIGCVRVYEVDGERYLDIPKWLSHQKIDRPTSSKIPGFDEGSRAFAKNSSGTGNGNREQGSGARSVEEDSRMPSPPAPVQAELIPDKKDSKSEKKPLGRWELIPGVELPEAFQTENCLEALKLWLKHKAERRESYKQTGLKVALAKLANEHTAAALPSAIEFSIGKNWAWVYRPQGNPQAPAPVVSSAPPSATPVFPADDLRSRNPERFRNHCPFVLENWFCSLREQEMHANPDTKPEVRKEIETDAKQQWANHGHEAASVAEWNRKFIK